MENLELLHSQEPIFQQEIIPIQEARYLDQLEQEYEDLWTLINASIRSTERGQNDVMPSIATNSSLPQAFRDRAMLVMYGSWEVRKSLGGGGARFGGCGSTGTLGNESQTELYDWLNETYGYQKEHGVELLSDYSLVIWWCEMFENNHIGQEQFETYIASVDDLLQALPKEDSGGNKYWTGRFPLVDEIFRGKESAGFSIREYGGPKVKAWAREQLDKWFRKQTGEDIEIPHWYAGISSQAALSLYKSSEYSWEERWPVIQHFGWDVFTKGSYDCINLLDKLDDKEMKHSLLKHLFDSHAEPKSDEDYPFLDCRGGSGNTDPFIDRVAEHAREIGDLEILRRVEVERQQIARYNAASQARIAERTKEREQERLKSPEYLAQVAAQIRTTRLIDQVCSKFEVEQKTSTVSSETVGNTSKD